MPCAVGKDTLLLVLTSCQGLVALWSLLLGIDSVHSLMQMLVLIKSKL